MEKTEYPSENYQMDLIPAPDYGPGAFSVRVYWWGPDGLGKHQPADHPLNENILYGDPVDIRDQYEDLGYEVLLLGDQIFSYPPDPEPVESDPRL